MRRTRRGSEASDDRRQGSGGKKAIGKRDAAAGGGAQLKRVGSHVISLGAGFFADVRARGRSGIAYRDGIPEWKACEGALAHRSLLSGSAMMLIIALIWNKPPRAPDSA